MRAQFVKGKNIRKNLNIGLYRNREIKVGDYIYIRPDALQIHSKRNSKSIPAHMGYTPNTSRWKILIDELQKLGKSFKVTNVHDQTIILGNNIHINKNMVTFEPPLKEN